MGSSDTDKFFLPINFKPEVVFGEQNEPVIVVSIIGKGRYNAHHTKASLFNQVIDSDVFLGPLHDENSNAEEEDSPCRIEGHYDESEHVIYLNLQSLYDTSTMVKLCKQAENIISSQGSHSFWRNAEHMHARALLYLFSISHILVLVHPGSSFNVHYVRFFRILETIRQKLLPSLSDLLHNLPVSHDWAIAGRPCSPRVLFVFEGCTVDSRFSDPETVVLSKTRSQKTPPIKRLQHAIEDQVYRILRKARIITNISNNSLFAVPANQEFVYVNPRPSETCDLVGFYMTQLWSSCLTARESEGARSKSYQANRRANSNQNNPSKHESAASQKVLSGCAQAHPHSFKEFLWQHIELAQTKGFNDNVGRNPLPAVFEMPTAEAWFHVCSALYDFFLVDHADTKARPHFNTLKSLLEVDIRFSESRCAKVLPLAEGAYQEGLPQHYTKSYHLTKLMAAKRVFQQHARGPAAEKYLAQLAIGCEKLWQAGRQLCEEVSLTGNHCVNQLHLLPDALETEDNCHLPIMSHSSQVKTKAACNCGRKQAEKDDPFDHRAANYEFYEKLRMVCCSKLESYQLPVFEPSTDESKAAITERSRSPSDGGSSTATQSTMTNTPSKTAPSRKDSGRLEISQAMSNLSLGLSLDQSSKSSNRSRDSDLSDSASASSGQSETSDLFTTDVQGSSFNPEANSMASQISQDPTASGLDSAGPPGPPGESRHPTMEAGADAEVVEGGEVEETGEVGETTGSSEAAARVMLVRQPSTTEYLPGMLHTNSPPGLLPKFPSWCLTSLGKYSSYSTSHGLDQPGFLHSSNFLLPYDVIVPADKEKWPVVGDSKKGKPRRIHKESGDSVVRIFFGNEYECPRGHRFFCSSPEKIFKMPVGGSTKETAHKLLNCDMPLYFPCHCRSAKGFMAQLMRVFVAVPEGPVAVSLKPMVQPGPPPCPLFHPGITAPLHLTNGHLWVLRFPHIYLGDHGPYSMPTDGGQLSMCRALRGLYQVDIAPPTS